jgi:NADH:ubiquinone reductase (non-electrogenic)
MASHLAMRTSSIASRRSLGFPFASRRCLSTSLRTNCTVRASKATSLPRLALQQSFRRAYADAPTVNLSPNPRPRKRFRFLRWTWRLTYLSAIGFVGWLTYTVWELRNPNDQFDPDPSKKTLVILGKLRLDYACGAFTDHSQGRVGARCRY